MFDLENQERRLKLGFLEVTVVVVFMIVQIVMECVYKIYIVQHCVEWSLWFVGINVFEGQT